MGKCTTTPMACRVCTPESLPDPIRNLRLDSGPILDPAVLLGLLECQNPLALFRLSPSAP